MGESQSTGEAVSLPHCIRGFQKGKREEINFNKHEPCAGHGAGSYTPAVLFSLDQQPCGKPWLGRFRKHSNQAQWGGHGRVIQHIDAGVRDAGVYSDRHP